jgi:hypothetical protein
MTSELTHDTPPITITLGGREYPMEPLNLNTMEAIEDAFGISFESVGDLMNARKIGTLKKLLSIFLTDSGLTPPQIGRLVNMNNLKDVSDAIAKAMTGG